MDSELRAEDIFSRVREKLNSNKIKLWLQPYYDDVGGVGELENQAFQLLCEQLVEELNIDQEHCISALRDLQNHALDRLNSNKVFKETGVASLQVKVSGEIRKTLTINLALKALTSELIKNISAEISIPIERIKLISHGIVLKPTESLESQGVKNAIQLMAVILADKEKVNATEKRFKAVENTKKDVELLAGGSNMNGEFYFQLENQAGETLNLPPRERKALVTAMALHEKGRAALKKEDYSLALVLFLEADKQYSECTSELLNTVDNYALLHLDISWCYLCLRYPEQIPDADRRLSLCEQKLHKTYGVNLERLMAIKGSTGNEAALFMRLHLLQGVVLFHQNKHIAAKRMFEKAQSELQGLKIDDRSLTLLLELGFDNSEALLGLRATHGNVEMAEELMSRRRKERELTRERNRLQLKAERERIKLGMCADGQQYCEPNLVQQMVAMGFHRRQSIKALKMSNNSISEAINLVQNMPLPNSTLPQPGCSSTDVAEKFITKAASLGCDVEAIQEAVDVYPEMMTKELEKLMQQQTVEGTLDPSVGTSVANLLDGVHQKRKAQAIEQQEAFARISEDLSSNDLSEDHLNLNLTLEEQFLIEYMSLLD